MDDLNCNGTEASIFECDKADGHNCDHSEDVAVKCFEPVNGSLCSVLRHDVKGTRDAVIMSPSSGLMNYSVTLPSPLARTDVVKFSIFAGGTLVDELEQPVAGLMSVLDTCGHENNTASEINKVLTARMARIDINIKPITHPFDCDATTIHAAKREPSNSFRPICIDEGESCTEGPATSGAGGRTCDYRFCRSRTSDNIHEHGFGTQVDTGTTRPLSRALGNGEEPIYIFSATLDSKTVDDAKIDNHCTNCIRSGHHARPLFLSKLPAEGPERFGCVDWKSLEENDHAEYDVGVTFRGPRNTTSERELAKNFHPCSFVNPKLRNLACSPGGSLSDASDDNRTWYQKSSVIPPHCPVVEFAIGAGKPATFRFIDVEHNASEKTFRSGLELVPNIRRAGLGLSFTIAFGEDRIQPPFVGRAGAISLLPPDAVIPPPRALRVRCVLPSSAFAGCFTVVFW